MVIKRKDFQKAAAFIHEFLLKLNEDGECAELRDTLNLALLYMQKYYRLLQSRSHEKNAQQTLQLTARGLSPMTPFVDAPDKFQWKWINLDSLPRLASSMSVEESVNFVTLPAIIQASKEGNMELIDELLRNDPESADDQDGIGRTALTYAVHFEQIDALNCLLENHADVNVTAHDGSTALHQACHDANHVALSFMLDYDGNVSIQDTHGRAPIHWAVTTPSFECLSLLLEHGADVGIRDKDGLTPCMWACRMDHIKHFELLSRAENNHVEEPDGIERDSNGRTWMHWAVRRSEPLECLQTLLTAETAAIKDDEGKTVLLLAAEMGSLPAARLIVEIAGQGCIQDTDNQGRTALHLSSMRGHGDVVNFLLEKGVDLNVVDNFNATAWDYARNRQLHYCQLIIMSHQRQRLASNPTSPMLNGLGLMDNLQFMNGSVNMDESFNANNSMTWRNRSGDSTPITPPHPPKRPRTSGMKLTRRANSLNTPEVEKPEINGERVVSSAGNERKKERIEVSVVTRKAAGPAFYNNGREETAMLTDEQHDRQSDEDVDGVSVGGMDVSDIDDEDNQPQPTTRTTHLHRQQQMQPCPPPRIRQPHPPQATSYTQPLTPQYRAHTEEYIEDLNNEEQEIEPQPPRKHPPLPSQRLPSTPGQGQVYRSGRVGPAPSPPNNIPQRPHMIRQQAPLPPRPAPREQPAPRLGSGPTSRDQVTSPPLSSGSDQPSGKSGSLPTQVQRQASPEGNRPGSGGQTKPPGVLEGRRIPPPMLTPLSNAPKPPSMDRFDKLPKRKKKKKKEKERDAKSPQNPLDIPPPRGFAAPLHPFPQGQQQARVQSGVPSGPRFSKGGPHYHEPSSSRYVEEPTPDDDKPPMVNGHAVSVRDGPIRSARPGHRSQPVEEDDNTEKSYDAGSSSHLPMSIAEEEEVGPLIPPPHGFRGNGRPLSQSVPQDNRTARMPPTSAKPPLPRGRNSASNLGRTSRNSGSSRSSTARRTPRPPTSRSESVS